MVIVAQPGEVLAVAAARAGPWGWPQLQSRTSKRNPGPRAVASCDRTNLPRQVLVGNKSDMDESKRAVPYSRGQALADEFKMAFFETSAKANTNVDETFQVPVGPLWGGCSECLLDWERCLGQSAALPWVRAGLGWAGWGAAALGCRRDRGAGGAGRGQGAKLPIPPPRPPPPPHTHTQSVARDIMVRLKDAAPDAGSGGGGGPSLRVGTARPKAAASSKGGCC